MFGGVSLAFGANEKGLLAYLAECRVEVAALSRLGIQVAFTLS